MKKIVFALQIFGLLTMFPLYMILELTHVKGPVSSPSVVIDTQGCNHFQPGVKVKNENAVFIIGQNKLLVKKQN